MLLLNSCFTKTNKNMKTQVNKLVRWGAAGAFGLMLTLNVMVGLDFEKDQLLPSLILVEFGNKAIACPVDQDCDGGTGDGGGVTCPAYGKNYGSCHRKVSEYYYNGYTSSFRTWCEWTGYQRDYCS